MTEIKQSTVNPTMLKPNPWNTNHCSPDAEEKIRESLRRFGMFKPIVVRTLDDGTLQILGGEHRARAAVDLGMEQVPIVNLGRIDERKAKEIGLVDNGRYGEDDSHQLAALLDELGVDELSNFMPFTDEEISSIFTASSIDLDSLSLPDERSSEIQYDEPTASMPQTHVIVRFKVPIDDHPRVTEAIERVMQEQGFDKDDSLSNAGNALVHILTAK